jgi:ubiquinone/menaquinone biosynthesis C-methylase UbiE
MVIKMINGWKIRNAVYETVHNINPTDLHQLVKSLEIKEGNIVADLMCGYGAVTREILKYHQVIPILLDNSEEQLKKSYQELGKIERIFSDIRECPLEDESIDRAVIKMGIHEVPKKDQQIIINQVYRILRQRGVFSMWDIMPTTEEEQILFQDIIRKKDKLAGFESFVTDRYFFKLDEGMNYLRTAGFKEVEHIHKMNFWYSIDKLLNSDFRNDKNKLEEWNEYIRQRVPENLKSKLGYVDKGEKIEMNFEQGIIKGSK